MTITENKTPISIELVITGRLDTGTAPELEVKLKEVAPQTQNLYLNMKDVQYISSSGLRVVLLASNLCSQAAEKWLSNSRHLSANRFLLLPEWIVFFLLKVSGI